MAGANSFDSPTAISGDAGIYNRVYIGFAGSGFIQLNYLLTGDGHRSAGPANDNDLPVGLNGPG